MCLFETQLLKTHFSPGPATVFSINTLISASAQTAERTITPRCNNYNTGGTVKTLSREECRA